MRKFRRRAAGRKARYDRHDPYAELRQEAEEFLRLCHHEEPEAGGPAALAARVAAVHAEIDATGTYRHTTEELAHGARVAWRNSNRCIGRLYWRSLRVRDRRDVRDADTVAAESADHLREATNGGRIRPLITVFAPDAPGRPGPRIWNEQLVRYAGYTAAQGGGRTGDPRNAGITAYAERLGWPGGPGTPFDVLPLIVQGSDDKPRWFTLPEDAVLEVPLRHPDDDWHAVLGLRWNAVPAIANMCLEIGGICYPAAPFNGWYMGTEIGARNLGDTDRYHLLPFVADRLGLDTSDERSLWKDRALVELNRAVLHSFDRAGVTLADHHTESRRFLAHLDREQAKGRAVGADWSWIVPPISGSATPVFHRTYDATQLKPMFAHHPEALARARGEESDVV
ncbi:nitric oxide synthase oxygenase [Streptomyces sp. FIT100]|uniref:nitric oxide synthase oxygenase n=1 Tax=Streptomyces sp. FIT100 TaxID=2837956 RepID=UPI0021C80B7D|nr:nitric oxide synthase oxygenase [Streptomyces sp. FIT100]UUN25372.1 nitric oxide synthase oxygenase [Streptomyces sp. FIT100]